MGRIRILCGWYVDGVDTYLPTHRPAYLVCLVCPVCRPGKESPRFLRLFEANRLISSAVVFADGELSTPAFFENAGFCPAEIPDAETQEPGMF